MDINTLTWEIYEFLLERHPDADIEIGAFRLENGKTVCGNIAADDVCIELTV